MSHDWKTVKNVVMGNSSSKPDHIGTYGQFVKAQKCLITLLYIVHWVITGNSDYKLTVQLNSDNYDVLYDLTI